MIESPTVDDIDALHAVIRSCRLCEDAGYLTRAVPIVSEARSGRIMLIGQAPGVVEQDVGRGFAGRSGRELFRWMASIGIGEEEFRRVVYMTAITKCFPGKARSGAGDRRPSGREIALCRPYLEAQLRLVRPQVILLVGGMAIERYFPRMPLNELIGRRFKRDGVTLIPLPHPSGASRWLNDPANRELLRQALEHVRLAWVSVGKFGYAVG